eukprot:COSAG04_NODE_2033_length_4964_cov_102.344913_7_plen_56_part_00
MKRVRVQVYVRGRLQEGLLMAVGHVKVRAPAASRPAIEVLIIGGPRRLLRLCAGR